MTNNHTFFTIFNALSNQDEPQPSWINWAGSLVYIATITTNEPRLLTYTLDPVRNGYFHTDTIKYTTQLELEQRMRSFFTSWLPYQDDASMFPSAFYDPPQIGLTGSQPTIVVADVENMEDIIDAIDTMPEVARGIITVPEPTGDEPSPGLMILTAYELAGEVISGPDIDDTQPIVPVRENYECYSHSLRHIGTYQTEGGETYDLYRCQECDYEQKLYDDIGGLP